MAGFDIISGDPRYTGGIAEMFDGVDFLPVAIGLFGMGEVLAGAEEAASGQILKAATGLRAGGRVADRDRLGALALGDRARHRARLRRRYAPRRGADGRLVPRLHRREEGLAPPRGVRPRRHAGV